jgi:spermidine synthase
MAEGTSHSSSQRRPVAKLLLLFIVFLSGAAVMIYEFLAVRVLTRYVGGSLDTWAAVISMCLAGLALGYVIGGWLADLRRSWALLGLALVVAGGFGYVIEPIIDTVALVFEKHETYHWWEPLVLAALSSLATFLALGTVLPQAMRLYVRDIGHVGGAAGWIGGISTVGSIAGVLLAAMLLIPHEALGVRRSFVLTSTSLIVVGMGCIIGAWTCRRSIFPAAMVFLTFAELAQAETRLLYEQYSGYHHILVADEDGKRVLYFDNDPQTIMYKEAPFGPGFEYTRFFHLPIVLHPSMNSVLFVGLGGGTGPKEFLATYPGLDITVIEVDPAVVRVAHDFFQVPKDPRLRIVTGDGRVAIRRGRSLYGAIVMDAYGSGPRGAYLPYHLATQEFFRAAAARLENGGFLVYNVVGVFGGTNDDIIRGMQTTLESVFYVVYAYRAKESENTVFVAQKIELDALDEDGTRDGLAWPEGPWLAHPMTAAQMAELIAVYRGMGGVVPEGLELHVQHNSPVQSAPRSGTIYTDDHAPVDLAPGSR